jgi:hypothetical protein
MRAKPRNWASKSFIAGALLAAGPLTSCGTGSTNPCNNSSFTQPKVPLQQRKAARHLALTLPLVERLLAGRSPGSVDINVETNLKGTLIGVQVAIRFQPPVRRVDATWPWLFVDDTGAMDPPYQIIRQHIDAAKLYFVQITVLAPAYQIGVVSNGGVTPGSRITPVPGAHDDRPPQPNCSD